MSKRKRRQHSKKQKRTVKCLRCGYDLQGLDINSNCPECGKSVISSIRLEFTKPMWTRARIAVLALWCAVLTGMLAINFAWAFDYIIISRKYGLFKIVESFRTIWIAIGIFSLIFLAVLPFWKRIPILMWLAAILGILIAGLGWLGNWILEFLFLMSLS